jgi:hypothetical protein
MNDDSLSRRYCVLTEGEDNELYECTVLPGAARVLDPTSIIPVTMEYDHNNIIGSANGFLRAGVIDGIAKITFNIRFNKESGLTHDDVSRLRPGVYLSDVYKFKQPGQHLDWVTDGLIREISFYDPRPAALKII